MKRIKNFCLFLIFIYSTFFNYTVSKENNWQPAVEGNKILLIRHSKAPGSGDPEGFNLKDCTTQRNLSEKGINQSKKIGKLFKKNKIRVDRVLSSQWCRCKDTAKIAFNNYEEFSALNSTFQPPYDKNAEKQINELKNFIQNWKGNGTNLVLVTHYVIIAALTNVAPRSGEIIIVDKNLKVLSSILTN